MLIHSSKMQNEPRVEKKNTHRILNKMKQNKQTAKKNHNEEQPEQSDV